MYYTWKITVYSLYYTVGSLQLLSGQTVSGEEACCSGSGEPALPAEGSTADEEVVILRSKLQQSEAVCYELRRELSQVKNECLQLHGTKVRLQLIHQGPVSRSVHTVQGNWCGCLTEIM